MTIGTTTANQLHNPRIPVQAKLAAAWTSFMFFYIYVDYFHLYMPGAIDDIRGGDIFEFTISPMLMTVFLALIGIPTLMVVLSMTLPARMNRVTNLVVAAIYVPVTVFNAVGESWGWAPFYALSIGVEVVLLALIVRTAWAWPKIAVAPAVPAESSADRG